MSHIPRTAANNSVFPHVAYAGDFGAMPTLYRWDPVDGVPGQEEGDVWTNSRMAGGLNPNDVAFASGMWAARPRDGGSQARKRLYGQTKDSTGAALGGCVVELIRDDGSQLADTQTADASGYYEVFAADPTGNYKVDAYKAGSPDVAGTTVNNLIPT